MKAEIVWALNAVVCVLSHYSNNDIYSFFSAMFANKATAEQFSRGRTKSDYVVNHGLSPSFKELREC